MESSISPWYTRDDEYISIAAIADAFKLMRYRYRLSAIDLGENIAIDIGDSFLTISRLIIGDIFREYR